MCFCGVTALLYSSLHITFTSLSAKQIGIVTAALMCNPVVMTQLFTFYNDLYLYLEYLALCALAIILWKKRNENLSLQLSYWIMAGVVTVLAVNTKFTHFFLLS